MSERKRASVDEESKIGKNNPTQFFCFARRAELEQVRKGEACQEEPEAGAQTAEERNCEQDCRMAQRDYKASAK